MKETETATLNLQVENRIPTHWMRVKHEITNHFGLEPKVATPTNPNPVTPWLHVSHITYHDACYSFHFRILKVLSASEQTVYFLKNKITRI